MAIWLETENGDRFFVRERLGVFEYGTYGNTTREDVEPAWDAFEAKVKAAESFIRMRETNAHEGETWIFYIQMEGNEEVMNRIRRAFLPDYTVCPDNYNADQVLNEALTCSEGYMQKVNICLGKVVLPAEATLDEALYGGGICDCMVEE